MLWYKSTNCNQFKIPLIIIFLFFLWKPLEFNKVTINGLELLQLLANSNPIINVQHLYLIIIFLNHTQNRYWNHSNYDNQQKLWILEFEAETWYSGHVRLWAPLLRYPSHPLLSTSAFSIPLVNCILTFKVSPSLITINISKKLMFIFIKKNQ